MSTTPDRLDTDDYDYELHHFGFESEIRGIRPVAYGEVIIATFPTPLEAEQAWSMMMEALAFHFYFGRESEGHLFS